jgi:hypothetical protein
MEGSDSRGLGAAAKRPRGSRRAGLGSSIYSIPSIVSVLLSASTFSGVALGQLNTAQNKTMAEALFQEGERLFDAGSFAEACPKFAESQELDPALGTAFRLAECYEKQGKIASAWSLYLEVANKLAGAGEPAKAEKVRQRAAALEPKLPKMVVEIPQSMADLPGIEVRRDGVLMGRASWGVALPVDPGKRVVRVAATGKEPWEMAIEATVPGVVVPVRVPVLNDLPAAKVDPPPVLPPNTAKGPGEGSPGAPALAFALGGVGLAGIGVGAAFGVLALNKASEWGERTGDPNRCARSAGGVLQCKPGEIGPIQEIEGSRSTFATVSTIGFIAGGALIAGGAVVWLASGSPGGKRPAMRLTPAVGLGGAAISLDGSF